VRLRTVEGRTTRDRKDWGRAIRAEVPREALAELATRDGRPDPVAVLEAQAGTRVPGLVPLRYARMLASPFAFLRGSAAVMAADLAHAPSSGIGVQLCGDAHLANFGVFATPERNLAFDLNDFDETHAGPFEWDVKRLATSVVVAARDRGYPEKVAADALRLTLDGYRHGIADAAGMTILEAWYHRLDLARIFAVLEAEARGRGQRRVLDRERQRVARDAKRRTSVGSLERLAEPGPDGLWRLREAPPLITRHAIDERVCGQVRALFEQYADSLRPEIHILLASYRPVDLARKVVGVGSVGTETFVFLLQSNRSRDVLFLQLKEAKPSVLAPWVKSSTVVGTRPIEHDGARVVVGQRLMQSASDQFLGWASGGRDGSQHFYLRQLRDMKMSADLTVMTPRSFMAYAGLCARALAFAHGRSGSAVAIAGYIGSSPAFVRAMERYTMAYADRTVEDHAALAAAAREGRITVADEASLGAIEERRA
jgi:uncharacterized protein (DUF2252 family)